jgi:hypothetical protein
MGSSWNQDRFAEYKLQLSLQRNNGGLSAWELINLVGMAHFSKGMNRQTVSMGITQVYQELILDVLKQVSPCGGIHLIWILYSPERSM